jgi:gamma-glutamylcyclotransferase (GGCT)/AIG2-like uncharacterized protein YtfP
MSKKKSIIVTIKEVTRKSKTLYLVTIDLPGNNPDDSPREYYASVYSAKRGAKRKLDAFQVEEVDGWVWVAFPKNGDTRHIEFVIDKKKKK